MTDFQNSYAKLEKSELKRIEINELPKEIPNFKNSFEPKDSLIKKWLSDWIVSAFKSGKIKENSLLPRKADLAYYLGVSVGTIQNAIRSVEDTGLLESKQRIGTVVRNFESTNPIVRKSTSKRERVIAHIKRLIIDSKYKLNQPMPSARQLSALIGYSTNTTRLALEYLCSVGILEAKPFRTNESNWILKRIPELTEEEDNLYKETDISHTLVARVEND